MRSQSAIQTLSDTRHIVQFVAYNPDIDYAIVSPAGRNELYIIAASRIEHLNKVTGEDLQIRARIPGQPECKVRGMLEPSYSESESF